MRLTCPILLLGCSLAAGAETISFRHDVMPVLARAGCNQGACHGNLNGKGGFKLSLRGEDPAFDLAAITRNMNGRRIDVMRPDESLLLRKASGRLPHEGGPRFAAGSNEYRILNSWIAAGAKEDSPLPARVKRLDVGPTSLIFFEPVRQYRLGVTAHFEDGSARDVTPLAVFEPTTVGTVRIEPDGTVIKLRDGELNVLVRYLNQQVPVTLAFLPARLDYEWNGPIGEHRIDRFLFPQWQQLRLTPSATSDDGTFLRRAFLDTLGILPTVVEAKAFLDDPKEDKRERLIDSLLKRPEFADFWAQKWSDLLRNEEKALDRKGVRVFHQWIRESIAAGKPMN